MADDKEQDEGWQVATREEIVDEAKALAEGTELVQSAVDIELVDNAPINHQKAVLRTPDQQEKDKAEAKIAELERKLEHERGISTSRLEKLKKERIKSKQHQDEHKAIQDRIRKQGMKAPLSTAEAKIVTSVPVTDKPLIVGEGASLTTSQDQRASADRLAQVRKRRGVKDHNWSHDAAIAAILNRVNPAEYLAKVVTGEIKFPVEVVTKEGERHSLGEAEAPPPLKVKAATTLLNKMMPDLKATEVKHTMEESTLSLEKLSDDDLGTLGAIVQTAVARASTEEPTIIEGDSSRTDEAEFEEVSGGGLADD